MDYTKWNDRIKKRSDMVTRLAHLTRGGDEDKAFCNLCKILEDKKLIANNAKGINVSNAKVCCFQEIPLVSIAENLRYEAEINQRNERYSPFGIRVLKGIVFQCGGRPVIYGDPQKLKSIMPVDEHWRIVRMDLSDTGNIIDWSHEREWRYPNDYEFEYSDIEIIVATPHYYKELINWCLENNHLNILKEVNGIVVLNSIYN